MNLSSVDETIKRPATAINQNKVNLNTRLRPLNNKSTYNKISTDNVNLYNNGPPFLNVSSNNKLLTRYTTRRLINVSPDGQGIHPISPLEKVAFPHMYVENSPSSNPTHLNVESFVQVPRNSLGNGLKKSIINSSKNPNFGIQRKITTKGNNGSSKKTKLKNILRKKTKITLKCFCILILLLIPIVIFIIMIIYSSNLELDKPREVSKNVPK